MHFDERDRRVAKTGVLHVDRGVARPCRALLGKAEMPSVGEGLECGLDVLQPDQQTVDGVAGMGFADPCMTTTPTALGPATLSIAAPKSDAL